MWKNPAPGAIAQIMKTVGRLRVHLAPNRQGRGHVAHVTTHKCKRGSVQKANRKGASGGCYNCLNQIHNRAHANGGHGTHLYGHMNMVVRSRVGAKPQPEPPRQLLNNSNLNIYETIYITRNIVWYVGSADFAKVWTGGEVQGSIPMDFHKF
jgi:hypothetical protein